MTEETLRAIRSFILTSVLRTPRRHMAWFLFGWAVKGVAAGFIGWAFGGELLGWAVTGLIPFLLGAGIDECARWKASAESRTHILGRWFVTFNTFDQTLQVGLAAVAFILSYAYDGFTFGALLVTYLAIVGVGVVAMYRNHPTAKQIKGESYV